eukprot:gnl/Trimastix_PCT/1645.p1 GENE.gnl/Trimastix_PCT/1645~~gnl/Trimastix_PCT/1645.p1  ORF type:complete len:127 (+),score=15.55 gnl/Trimastix_PCT/1645:92-472(+)
MNAPDRFELFVLPDGVERVSMEKDTKVQNAATFRVQLEDHTLGNIIRMQLLRDPHVLFAGYQIPHPLENVLVVRIQTDGTMFDDILYTPTLAFINCLKDLQSEMSVLQERFQQDLERYRETHIDAY